MKKKERKIILPATQPVINRLSLEEAMNSVITYTVKPTPIGSKSIEWEVKNTSIYSKSGKSEYDISAYLVEQSYAFMRKIQWKYPLDSCEIVHDKNQPISKVQYCALLGDYLRFDRRSATLSFSDVNMEDGSLLVTGIFGLGDLFDGSIDQRRGYVSYLTMPEKRWTRVADFIREPLCSETDNEALSVNTSIVHEVSHNIQIHFKLTGRYFPLAQKADDRLVTIFQQTLDRAYRWHEPSI